MLKGSLRSDSISLFNALLRGDGLMLELTDARMTGKRGSGRKRIGMLDELIEESCVELKGKVQDRQFWRSHGPAIKAEH